MVTVECDLEGFSGKKIHYPIHTDGTELTAKRLFGINSEYKKKIEMALSRMDFTPPFDLEEVRMRLDSGFYFFLLENENQILGWTWAAPKKVFFDEFYCNIELKDKHCFSFNTYICKDFRGKRLSQLVLNEKLYQLKKNGYSKAWALIYKSNGASMKSYRDNGWREIGNYKFIRLFFMEFRFPPKGI